MKKNYFISLLVLFTALSSVVYYTGSEAQARKRRKKYHWKITGKININQASSRKMQLLPGIGSKKAKAIVKYRKQKRFSKIDQIKRIKGIGSKLFAKMKSHLKLSGKSNLKRVKVRHRRR